MPEHPPLAPGQILRHFTVAVFVVHAGRVLLHYHRRLRRWLPPGGHIEDGELPDEAAEREVLEETGIRIQLVGRQGLEGFWAPDAPRQLVVPAGVQLEDISAVHQHIDLVYFALPLRGDLGAAEVDPALAESDQVGWYALEQLAAMGASLEIQAWAERALAELGGAN